MTETTKKALTVQVDAQGARNLLSALYDKKFETKRYLSSYPAESTGPSETDSCCEYNFARYRMREQEAASLRRRLSEVTELIEQVEPQAAEIEIEEPEEG